MQFKIDHDYHIHSTVSGCCYDPQQTPENILKYAEEKGLSKIVLADHFWDRLSRGDERFCWKQYDSSSMESLKSALPLPESDKVEFVFGCEADMDENLNIGVHESNYDTFGFIVVSTTHFHFWYGSEVSVSERAKLYIKRFEKLLESDLPLNKVGIAHLTTHLIANQTPSPYLEVLDKVSDATYYDLFRGAKEAGIGIELNFKKCADEAFERVLRPFFIAKDCGCKFYVGSDSHSLDAFEPAYATIERAIKKIGLTEDDKFHF